MASETKQLLYAKWEQKMGSMLIPDNLYYRFQNVEDAIIACNDKLSGTSLGTISYSSMTDRFREYTDYCARLNAYVYGLESQVEYDLETPFYKAANEAAQYLSEIKLEDYLTDNLVGVTEENSYHARGYSGSYTTTKDKIGFEDFFGQNMGVTKGTSGYTGTKTVDCVKDFAQLFEDDYNEIKEKNGFDESDINSLDDYLKQLAEMGEFDHDLDRPFLNFISGALDITIIKPLIECGTGRDMITKERLTETEKTMKVTFAVIDIATLGYGLAASELSKMTGKEALKFAGKYVFISASGDLAGYTAGYVGNELGLPTSVCMILSIASNAGVSAKLSQALFKGNVLILDNTFDDTPAGTQKRLVASVENGEFKLETTMHKGNYGEMKMDIDYETQGYCRISIDRVTDLNGTTHQGIDGVYENLTPPPKYVIAESKYGTSTLSMTNDGRQMSQKWIYGKRLDEAVGKKVADEIRAELMMDPENVQSVLFHTASDGSTTKYILDAKGNKVK